MSFQEDELSEFRTEAVELLETAEASLLALEQGEDFKVQFDIIFRVFHNLKGACGMMGLVELGAHMHNLENILNSTRDDSKVNKDQMDTFLKGIDQARVMLGIKEATSSDLAGNPPPEKIEKVELSDGIREFLIESQEISQRVSKSISALEKDGPIDVIIDSIYRDIHTLKGGAYLFHFKELGDLNHAFETALDLARRHEIKISKTLIDGMYGAIDLIDLYLLKIEGKLSDNLAERVQSTIGFFGLMATKVSVSPEKDQTEVTQIEKTQTDVISIEKTPIEMNPNTAAKAELVSTPNVESETSTIRVPVSLLDKLMTLMGEMVLVRNQVIQYSNRTDDLEFLNLSQRLNVVTGEIQGEMMKTRMQPIGNVLTKFSRLVRELSKSLGKKIELELIGSETELDKTLLEAVKDPLTHIVRNSCDHGIESLDERRSSGKPETGMINIKSYHEGGQVIIEISDDGKGLNRAQLLKKAIEKGIIKPENAATLSDRETVNLIFAPGFSTAAKVTNVSGRGVGMDVVKTNIEKIGGSVDLQSVQGQGTTIRLKIPLTLAIVPAMVVRCDTNYFAIPQLKLVELVRVDSSSDENKIEYIQGSPVYRLRGHILPLVHIRKVLGLGESDTDQQEISNIVVLKSDHNLFGLIVDDIQDTADIVVKPLARFLKPISVYSGATVLGDGSIALILDIAGIVKELMAPNEFQDQSSKKSQTDSNLMTLSDRQDFLLVKIGVKEKHALLLSYVHRLEEFKRNSIEQSGKKRLVRYRDSVLPLIALEEVLGISANQNEEKEVISVVVIEKGGMMYGIEVQEILDVLTTDKPLDTTLTSEKGIIGNLVTEQEVIVVVDPYQIIKSVVQLDPIIAKNNLKENSVPLKQVRKILYVEDAIFFRRHVKRVLESAGFEVTLANNGKEAKELLEKAPAETFDVIISDIEMPLMNGFEFGEFVRSNDVWKQTPLIALSTRSDQNHIDRGMEVGFDLYLEKMNGDELIKSIQQFSRKGAA